MATTTRATCKRVLLRAVICSILLATPGPVERAASQPPGRPTVTVYKSPT